MSKLNLLVGDYMVVNLNLPQLKEGENHICSCVGERMEKFFREEQEKLATTGSAFDGLFVTFKITNEGRIMEPIIDEYRFHCENFLSKIDFHPTAKILKYPKSVPRSNNQLQYILKRAEDLAKQIGGSNMKMIYNSLLVSVPVGENQDWHFDVHDSHAPDFPVLAMIIALKPGTMIEAKINGNVIKIDIPVGSALAFDGKNLLHRGLAYQETNTRIYLKFAVKNLTSTQSGDAEVAPLLTCSYCRQQFSGEMRMHHERCYDYVLSCGDMTPERVRNFIARVIQNERKIKKKYYKAKAQDKRKSEDSTEHQNVSSTEHQNVSSNQSTESKKMKTKK